MAAYYIDIYFKEGKTPKIEDIAPIFYLNTGMDLNTVTILYLIDCFYIKNIETNKSFEVFRYLDQNLITLINYESSIDYTEGALIDILISNFEGEVQGGMNLPVWTKEKWQGIEWWNKVNKKYLLKIKVFRKWIRI